MGKITEQLLKELLKQVAPDDSVLTKAVERRNFVIFSARQFPGAYKYINSGSVAHMTVIFTVTDADCAIVINRSHYPKVTSDGDGDGPADIVEELAGFIRPILQAEYPNVWVRTARKRSILISFRDELADGQDPTVDLIVAFNRKDAPGVWIPNLKANRWDPSDPEKHTELVLSANKSSNGISSKAIRLGKLYLKQWDPPLLHSFNITALALECIQDDTNLASALLTLLQHSAASIGRGNTKDPAEISSPIKIPEEYTREHIQQKFQSAADRLAKAIDPETDLETAIELLSKIFRKHTDIIENAGKKLEVEEGIKSNSLGVTSGLFVTDGSASRNIKPTRAYGGEINTKKHKKIWGKSGPWFSNEKERMLFERGIQGSGYKFISSAKKGQRSKSFYEYTVEINVEPYDSFIARIEFSNRIPRVYVDSLETPRHSYSDGSLCMWYPYDDQSARWNKEDGLLSLFDIIKTHIFKELRFKETGIWLGNEIHNT